MATNNTKVPFSASSITVAIPSFLAKLGFVSFTTLKTFVAPIDLLTDAVISTPAKVLPRLTQKV